MRNITSVAISSTVGVGMHSAQVRESVQADFATKYADPEAQYFIGVLHMPHSELSLGNMYACHAGSLRGSYHAGM